MFPLIPRTSASGGQRQQSEEDLGGRNLSEFHRLLFPRKKTGTPQILLANTSQTEFRRYSETYCCIRAFLHSGNSAFPEICIPGTLHSGISAFRELCIPGTLHSGSPAFRDLCITGTLHSGISAFRELCIPGSLHYGISAFRELCIPAFLLSGKSAFREICIPGNLHSGKSTFREICIPDFCPAIAGQKLICGNVLVGSIPWGRLGRLA